MALTAAQNAQLNSIKQQALAIQAKIPTATQSKPTTVSSPTTASSQLKALSVASAQPTTAAKSTSTTSSTGGSGGSSLRDLSIALANNKPVTQAQINSGSLPNTGTAANPNVANIPNYAALTAAQRAPSGVTTPSVNADTYFKSLINAMQPTSAETSIQDQQTALDSTLRDLKRGQDVTDNAITDQPIALPFITGQKAAVARQYGTQVGAVTDQQQTLAQRLANLQAKRQSSIDINKTALDYATSQQNHADALAQQQAQQAFAQKQFDAQQAQQQYANTTQASQYADQLAQQKLANQIALSKANSGSAPKASTQIIDVNGRKVLVNTQTGATIADLGSSTSDAEAKQIQAFNNEAAKYVEKLGANTISWGTAFNALKAAYPQASNELIDQTLGKDRYYNVNP